jgi:hypothetical protein
VSKPTRYHGATDVAAYFGVQGKTVNSWISRYAATDTPCPVADVQIGNVLGWLPEREHEWRKWKKSLPGPGVGGGRPRSTDKDSR